MRQLQTFKPAIDTVLLVITMAEKGCSDTHDVETCAVSATLPQWALLSDQVLRVLSQPIPKTGSAPLALYSFISLKTTPDYRPLFEIDWQIILLIMLHPGRCHKTPEIPISGLNPLPILEECNKGGGESNFKNAIQNTKLEISVN
jgi:hypothetical protein